MGDVKKIVVFVIILSLLGSGFVFWLDQANANVLYFLKEFVIRPLIRTLANALENKIVNSVIAKISGIKQGQPSFITNWRNQILDSEGRGNDIFRSVLADSKLCPYFKDNLQTAFGADKYAGTIAGATIKNSAGQVVYQNKTTIPGLPSFQNLANCTLPADLNVNVFRTDFTKGGGWDAWSKLIEPQNNFLGAYSLALGEQAKQTQTESQSSQNQSIAGQGFIGSKLGISGSNPNGCVGSLSGANRCLFLGKEVTPPKLIADLNSTALGSKISRAGFGTELTDVIQGLIGAVMTGLLQGIANQLGQTNYNTIVGGTESLFDESQSNTAIPSNLQNAGSGGNCRAICSNNYNSCINQSSVDASVAEQNTALCSSELTACDANCPP